MNSVNDFYRSMCNNNTKVVGFQKYYIDAKNNYQARVKKNTLIRQKYNEIDDNPSTKKTL